MRFIECNKLIEKKYQSLVKVQKFAMGGRRGIHTQLQNEFDKENYITSRIDKRQRSFLGSRSILAQSN